MKRILLLTTFLTLLLTTGINAQNDVAYPVDLNVQIIPPYNTCIRDMAPAELNNSMGRFRVTMLVRDMAHSFRPFKIRMKVRNTSGQELFSTLSGEYSVRAGYPNLLSSYQLLNEFFTESNIIHGNQFKTGCFSEGAYVFAFQVVDGANPALPVSREFQCFTFLEQGAPPMLIFPANRSTVQQDGSMVIPFRWQLPYVTGTNETFILEVYEVPEGMNPNEVFNRGLQPVYENDNIQMTVCFVEITAGTFQAGKQYAWRVKIKDREAYINQGISEVFTFTYGTPIGTTEKPPVIETPPTLPKVIIDSVGTSSGSAIVYWQNKPEYFSGYIVEVRRSGSDAPWSSVSAGYEDSSLVLSNIAPKIEYEVRIKGLEQQAGGAAYGIYSDTVPFTIAAPEDIDCGKPLPALDNSTPTVAGVAEGFVFKANGQNVQIETVSINENSFSGTGYIDFPLLKLIKIKVEFNNIQINENNELLSGTVKTVYDESTGLIMDLNRLLNKGDGGTADGPVTPLDRKIYPSKEAALAGLTEGEFGQVAGSDTLYVKTGNNTLAPVGTVLPPAFRYENKGKLETNTPYIVFSQPEGANLAFDNNSGKYFDLVYRLKDTYEKLNANYTVPWLAMNPGRIEHVDASVKGGSLNMDSVKFIIPLADGSTLKLDHNGVFDVQIPGGSAGTTTEIFAVTEVNGTNKVVGKLKLANYTAKTQKVNLVPVRRDKSTIDGTTIQTELNRIYGDRLGIQFTVEVKERFGDKDAGDPDDELDFLDDGLQVDDKKFWSNETAEMKYLKYLYHEANEIEEKAAYLFVIDFANRNDVEGDMPRGKQVGYVFCENKEIFADGRLVAHELGHGLYGLEHTFASSYGVSQGSTNNLMDYVSDDFLTAWQWKIINNPGIVWNFLEEDEDGMVITQRTFNVIEFFRMLRLSIINNFEYIPHRYENPQYSHNFYGVYAGKDLKIGNNTYTKLSAFENKSYQQKEIKVNKETLFVSGWEVITGNETEANNLKKFLNGEEKNIYGTYSNSILINGEEINFSKVTMMSENMLVALAKSGKYSQLSFAERTIVDIPIIQWKLGHYYGASLIRHWFLGSGEQVNFDDKNIEELLETSKIFQEHLTKAIKTFEKEDDNRDIYKTDGIDIVFNKIDKAINNGENIVKVNLSDNYKPNEGGINRFYEYKITETDLITLVGKIKFEDYTSAIGSVNIHFYFEGGIEIKGYDRAFASLSNVYYRIYPDVFNFVDEGITKLISQPLGGWDCDVFNINVSKPTTSFQIQNKDFVSLYKKYKGVNDVTSISNVKPNFLITTKYRKLDGRWDFEFIRNFFSSYCIIEKEK